MNVLGVTLARGGSKGVPNKHTRDLCGKPMIAWTMEAADKSTLLTDYIVSSDSAAILKIATDSQVIPIWRPKELAQDTTPTLPALQHAVSTLETILNFRFDYIIEIRATSPLKTTADIDGMIQKLVDSGADSVIGVTELSDHHPQRAKYLDGERIKSFLPEVESGRRQDMLPKAYVRNGTVYALRRDAVMGEGGKLFGHENSIAYIMPAERSVNIDTELDFKLCELLLAERLEREQGIVGSGDRVESQGFAVTGLRTDTTSGTGWSEHRQVPIWVEQGIADSGGLDI